MVKEPRENPEDDVGGGELTRRGVEVLSLSSEDEDEHRSIGDGVYEGEVMGSPGHLLEKRPRLEDAGVGENKSKEVAFFSFFSFYLNFFTEW